MLPLDQVSWVQYFFLIVIIPKCFLSANRTLCHSVSNPLMSSQINDLWVPDSLLHWPGSWKNLWRSFSIRMNPLRCSCLASTCNVLHPTRWLTNSPPAVLTVNYVVQDGKSNWLEGFILMCQSCCLRCFVSWLSDLPRLIPYSRRYLLVLSRYAIPSIVHSHFNDDIP